MLRDSEGEPRLRENRGVPARRARHPRGGILRPGQATRLRGEASSETARAGLRLPRGSSGFPPPPEPTEPLPPPPAPGGRPSARVASPPRSPRPWPRSALPSEALLGPELGSRAPHPAERGECAALRCRREGLGTGASGRPGGPNAAAGPHRGLSASGPRRRTLGASNPGPEAPTLAVARWLRMEARRLQVLPPALGTRYLGGRAPPVGPREDGRPGVGSRRRRRQNNKGDDKCLLQCLFLRKNSELKLAQDPECSQAGSPGPPTARPSDQRAGQGTGLVSKLQPPWSSEVARPTPPHPTPSAPQALRSEERSPSRPPPSADPAGAPLPPPPARAAGRHSLWAPSSRLPLTRPLGCSWRWYLVAQ